MNQRNQRGKRLPLTSIQIVKTWHSMRRMRFLILQRQWKLTTWHGGDLARYQVPMAHVLHCSVIPPLVVIGIWSDNNSHSTNIMCTIGHIILRIMSIVILPQLVVKGKPTLNDIQSDNNSCHTNTTCTRVHVILRTMSITILSQIVLVEGKLIIKNIRDKDKKCQHCCSNWKKWEECLIDIPQIKGGVHHHNEQRPVKTEMMAVIDQPLKRQRHLMCSACIWNMECLAVQQDVSRGNGDGQAVPIHLIVKKRQHCKKQTLFEKGLREQSCKQ